MGISGSLDISPQTGDSGLDCEQNIDHHSDTDYPRKHFVILIFLPFPIQTTPLNARNDADTLGVRSGCTFIGYTNDNFDSSAGRFVLTAGALDRFQTGTGTINDTVKTAPFNL